MLRISSISIRQQAGDGVEQHGRFLTFGQEPIRELQARQVSPWQPR